MKKSVLLEITEVMIIILIWMLIIFTILSILVFLIARFDESPVISLNDSFNYLKNAGIRLVKLYLAIGLILSWIAYEFYSTKKS